MEMNQLRTVERTKEQLQEMMVRHETKAAVSKEHTDLVAERKALAEGELWKFRALLDALASTEKYVDAKITALQEREETPAAAVAGYEHARKQIQDLRRQAQEGSVKNEGAFMALQALERTFQDQTKAAEARARGLEIQEKRAVGVAERSEEGNQVLAVSGVIEAPTADPPPSKAKKVSKKTTKTSSKKAAVSHG